MEFRTYDENDRSQIIKIFHSNCPKYFDANDEPYLTDFLDNYADENYLVVTKDEKIIGCGGHYTKANLHGIAWAMLERNSVGHKNLLRIADGFYKEIENSIIAEGKFYDVHINTTQLMEKLFSRYGFYTYDVIKDGFGRGLDEYKMKKRLITNLCNTP